MNISFTTPYHHVIRKASFTSAIHYNKFLNWISGEFDLFLQDESNGLQVFFPNGKFNIKNIKKTTNSIIAEINIECKVLQNGVDLDHQIMSVYNRLS
jgi:hypothetical protein